ncbi:hypothetical protein [Sphaerisporangium rhizosphaerae]|uniref:Uncharacterized protein n=1 Tax=Sphaerisporangium rhizosphaerae TaxID=2269375 RepID=A0ABW2NYA6_9ACTN
MSARRPVPDAGTTWDEIRDIWDEVREIVLAWEHARAADDPEG